VQLYLHAPSRLTYFAFVGSARNAANARSSASRVEISGRHPMLFSFALLN
jgi:hypothetical protein